MKYIQINTDMATFQMNEMINSLNWEIPSLQFNPSGRIALSSAYIQTRLDGETDTYYVKMFLNVIEEDSFNSDGLIAAVRIHKGNGQLVKQTHEFWNLDSARPRIISLRLSENLKVTNIDFAYFVLAIE